MAKSQTNQSTTASNNLINQANTLMPPVIQGLQGQSSQAQANQALLLGQATTGFDEQQRSGGYDPTQLANLRTEFADAFSSGGYDPTQLASLRGQYSSLLPTGGYDPTQLSNLRTSLASMQETGGMDPAALARTTSGYTDFANTGGYTPAMQSEFLQRATTGNRNLTDALASAAKRSAAASGGNAQAAIADIARQGGQTEATTTTNAMLGLGEAINQGKLSGLQGLDTTEAQLAAARQGITGQRASLESGVSAGARDILGQAGSTEANVATGQRAFGGLQSGLESGVASGVQAANVGLAGLFNTQTGQVSELGRQVLQGLGLQFGTEAQGAEILQALSKNPGLFQTIFGDITSLIGAAGGGVGLKALGVP